MNEISELERRITAALDRIARAAERGAGKAVEAAGRDAGKTSATGPDDAAGGAAGGAAATTGGRASAETALREALEAERTANAQLTERVRAIRDRQETMVSQIERKLARATEQLDVQGLELQRLRRANTQMVEANRRLIAAQEEGLSDAGAINKALQAELESLRAARRSEMTELEEIMGELAPLIEEKANG